MNIRSIRIPNDIDRSIDYVARSEKLEKAQFLTVKPRIFLSYNKTLL